MSMGGPTAIGFIQVLDYKGGFYKSNAFISVAASLRCRVIFPSLVLCYGYASGFFQMQQGLFR